MAASNFSISLPTPCARQAQADDATVIIYEQGELPGIAYAKPLEGAAETALNTYLTGPFLLDPFYRAAQHDDQFGVFRLVDSRPRALEPANTTRPGTRAVVIKTNVAC